MEKMNKTLWLPTRPITLIDAINRRAAATGSIQYAMNAEHGDYNGHHVTVRFNDYRRYWITEYFWGGRVVLARSSDLESCLRAAKEEYDRGARGCTVMVHVSDEAERETAARFGFVPHSKEIEAARSATYKDPRFDKLSEAADFEKWGLFPGAIGVLANSKTVEEYEAKKAAWKTERKNARPRIPEGPSLEDIR